ncbi:MAG: ATP-binding cassette domain-containing protein [Desulfuromonadales bacterium]|nr:ATP-binding cassette domain-containing protein [Desulfuromonadales bacterium]
MITFSNAKIIKPGFELYIGNIHIGPGLVLLRGQNGSGKSTFLRALAGKEILTDGSLELQSQLRLGYVPQHYKEVLQPWLSGWSNLNLLRGPSYTMARRLRQMGFPLQDLRKRPKQLSGGQCQRIAVVRELHAPSDVLLLDEPFSGMDSLSAKKTWAFFLDHVMRDNRKTILIATHLLPDDAMVRREVKEIVFTRNREDRAYLEMRDTFQL